MSVSTKGSTMWSRRPQDGGTAVTLEPTTHGWTATPVEVGDGRHVEGRISVDRVVHLGGIGDAVTEQEGEEDAAIDRVHHLRQGEGGRVRRDF